MKENKNMFYGALPIHFEFAKELRNNQTEAEILLWNNLDLIHINGIRFKRTASCFIFHCRFLLS